MTGTYNLLLVLLSILVASIASYVALDLVSRVVATQGTRASRYWLVGGALSMGTGIWSMHFVGMLAFQLPIPMAYNIPVTLLSLLIAVIVSGFALHTLSHGSLRRLLGAGVLMGIGIACMHYSGMAAMEVRPSIRYDPLLFALSVLIAIAASVAALWIAFQLRMETILSAFWKKAGSALVMGAAITGMHYTAMAAAHFAPDAVCSVSPQDINNVWLAGAIGGFTFMFLATTMLISVFDAHLGNRTAKHAEHLGRLNVHLEKQATELSQANAQLQDEVQERKRSEERIQYLAYHDSLTALPNRSFFSKLLNHGISQAHRHKRGLAVLFIDLDRFKHINDTLGHEVGDTLLQEVAKRLKSCLRESDTVARLGGDEFVVLLEEIDYQQQISIVAHKMLMALVKPFVNVGQEFHVTGSIGISVYPVHGEDEQSLMKNADIAMYRAKEEGKKHSRQPVGPAVFRREPPAGCHFHPRGHRAGPDPARAGNHREHAHAERREGDGHVALVQRPRHPVGHRRFWNGLFLAVHAQAVSRQHDQGGSLVHSRSPRRARRQGHHRSHHRDGPDLEHDRDRGRRRDQGAGRLPARPGLR
jgi:diguanylate cyclase (GGDEF)-like protein